MERKGKLSKAQKARRGAHGQASVGEEGGTTLIMSHIQDFRESRIKEHWQQTQEQKPRIWARSGPAEVRKGIRGSSSQVDGTQRQQERLGKLCPWAESCQS